MGEHKKEIERKWVTHPQGKIPPGEWCDHCYRFNARNSTCDVIIIWNKNILLQQRARNPQKGFWALVGGYLDWNETLEECAQREVKEEVGYDVKVKFFGNYSHPSRDPDGRQNVDHVFTAVVDKDIPRIQKEEIMQAGWFSPDNLPEKIAFDHRRIIEDFRDRFL